MSKVPRLTDTTLRDGDHAVSHSYTPEMVRTIVRQLDEAGVPVIEVSHGSGFNGSTIQQGFSVHSEFDLIQAAVETAKQAKIASLFVPGIGTSNELRKAVEIGIQYHPYCCPLYRSGCNGAVFPTSEGIRN